MVRAGYWLWLALLAFSLPEVFAGTGAGWLTRPDVYILGLPLYALHLLLLCHIAAKTGRTSWPALYLFGLVFGLYETWITKVVWAGYMDADGFAMGGIGPWFGLHETLGLVLFYHAVTSFLLPLAVLTRLFPAFAATFPAPDWIFGPTRWALARRIGLALLWGVISGHNMPDVRLYLISWVPMLLGLILGYRLIRDTDAARPALGRAGQWGAVLGLVVIYVGGFLLLRTEAIPPAPALAITLALYPVLALLIWQQPPRLPSPRPPADHPARMPFFWLVVVFLIGLASSVAVLTGGAAVANLAVVPFVGMVPLGAGLFVWLVLWRGLVRKA